jgi:hypothetical protein
MMRSIFGASLLLALAAASVAGAAELVVVDARGGGLRPGQKIADDRPLILKDGERVTLIAADGRTVKLTGPHDKAPVTGGGAEGTSILAAFEALKTQKDPRLSKAGVVRNVGVGPDLPDPWVADARRGGNVCLKPGAPIVFWRAEPGETVPLSLTPADRSWRATASWAAGQDRVQMPALFPLRDRAAYVVKAGDSEAALTINIIPEALVSERMQAAFMIEKRCQAQAEALIRAIQ